MSTSVRAVDADTVKSSFIYTGIVSNGAVNFGRLHDRLRHHMDTSFIYDHEDDSSDEEELLDSGKFINCHSICYC